MRVVDAPDERKKEQILVGDQLRCGAAGIVKPPLGAGGGIMAKFGSEEGLGRADSQTVFGGQGHRADELLIAG